MLQVRRKDIVGKKKHITKEIIMVQVWIISYEYGSWKQMLWHLDVL